MNPQPSTLDRLGLAGWEPGDRASHANLGSLAGVFDTVCPARLSQVVVPAQRVAPLAEAATG